MVIVFTNTKGGVGKSTLATHVAVWLFDQGRSVALLDCDEQRSASEWIREAEPQISVRVAGTPEEVAEQVRGLRRDHEVVVADAPGRLGDESRTLMLLADLAVFPMTPSILDFRSVAKATAVLKYAHTINNGRPTAKLILNRIKKRETISRELAEAAPSLGLSVAPAMIRDLQAFRDAAQQGTVVTRMGVRARQAASDVATLFAELLAANDPAEPRARQGAKAANE